MVDGRSVAQIVSSRTHLQSSLDNDLERGASRSASLEKDAQASLTTPTAWSSLGPSGFQRCAFTYNNGSTIASWGTCSGRVTALVLDSAHAGTIYAGAASGGVWKSLNGGLNWLPLTDNLANSSLAIGSMALSSDGTIYAGTGEGNCASVAAAGGSGICYYGTGLLRSSDGGNSWTQLGSSLFSGGAIDAIVVNATHSNIVLIATTDGWTGGSTGTTFRVLPTAPLGTYLSTNGGVSWTRTITSVYDNTTSLAVDPNNSNIVYAGVDGTIYKSINSGSTWTRLSVGLPPPLQVIRIYLAVGPPISPSTFNTLFAAMDVNTQGELFRSTDGGASWSRISTPPGPFGGTFCDATPTVQQCLYNIYVAPDPKSSNILYLGGVDLYRSTDGGVSWTDLGGYTGSLHVDQHALAFNSTSATSTSTPGIFVANDGGIWSSNQGNTCSPTSCWKSLNLGLGITQFYDVAAHPSNPAALFGGAQDNGVLNRTGPSGWSMINGGDGGWTGYARNNPTTMYMMSNGPKPFRSDNGGAFWQAIASGINPLDSGLFMDPVAMDYKTPTTLYLGTTTLYKTINGGTNWQSLGNTGLTGDRFSAISVAPSNGSYLYVGTEIGRFFVSTNGGLTFFERDSGLPIGSAVYKFMTKIAVDPLDPRVVFVTMSGLGGKHVFGSPNSGLNWVDLTRNLPDYPGYDSIIIDLAENVFVGTDFGVFVVNNALTAWSGLGLGLPPVPVFDLQVSADGSLIAATYGRGIWSIVLHDGAVTALALSRSFAYAGVISVPVQANLTVANLGAVNATLIITVFANSTRIGSQTTTLVSGQTLLVTVNLNTTSLTRGSYVLTVQIAALPGESDLSNNTLSGGTFTVKLKGDVNGDCKVDIIDLATVGIHFGQSSTSLGFNSAADLNNDGKIDIIDLALIGLSFGSSC